MDIAIADLVFDDHHELGYKITRNMKVSSKIDFFYDVALPPTKLLNPEKIKNLKSIVSKSREINTFRNNIVHADWSTLSKDNYVRTKIESNKEGEIEFVKVKISPEEIGKILKEIEKLIIDIEGFSPYDPNYYSI